MKRVISKIFAIRIIELTIIFANVSPVYSQQALRLTQCQCDECIRAKGDESCAQSYGDLMVKMSRERIMQPAHAVNPKVKVIIKFPQWFDNFHLRGYEVVREPRIFDGIWCGTESRNFDYLLLKPANSEHSKKNGFAVFWVTLGSHLETNC